MMRRNLTASALATLGLLWVAPPSLAEETIVPIPWGWRVDQRAVTIAGDRVAMGVHQIKAQEKARIVQSRGGEPILTDVAAGWCSAIQYNPQGSHLLATIALRHQGALRGSRFYLVDAEGEVAWTSVERQTPRFSTSGELFYVLSRNEPNRVTVYNLEGEPVREALLDRPFSDAILIGKGEELIVLFKKQETSGASLERIKLDGDSPLVWKLEFDSRALPPKPNIRLIAPETLLIEMRSGFAAVALDGSRYDFRPASLGGDDPIFDVDYYRNLTPHQGPRPGTLLLAGDLQTHLLDLGSGKLEKTKIRLASYFRWLVRDRKMIVVRNEDVVIRPLTDMEE